MNYGRASGTTGRASGPAGIQMIELDRRALHHNVRCLRGILAPATRIMPVVKANAYGHGMNEIISMLDGQDIFGFGVNSVNEGIQARNLTGDRILLLGGILAAEIPDIVSHDLEPTIFRKDILPRLARETVRQRKIVRVHLKIDTGTNRQGVNAEDLHDYIRFFKTSRAVKLEGLSTHFANIEDTTDHSYANQQKKIFQQIIALFRKHRLIVPLKHTACSAAGILFPDTHYSFIRLGISLYGLWPSKETYVASLLKHGNRVKLQPVLSWKTRIVQVKAVPAGAYVGYGCTYRTTHRSRLAILPIGYYDGYDRKLSNQSWVIIRGRRAPVRGRVCMNITIVDITDIPAARVEDEVILIGRSGDESVTADDLARMSGTINYEVVTRLNPSIPRRIV